MAVVDNDLICNYKKCRKRLVNNAWVTSCSHTFCDEDGTREFNKALVCPACETNLSGKHDIVRHDLQPADQYKSMILAGLKPEIIMEIASRAIAFWTYQAQQEKLFHQYSSNKHKESRNKLESYYEQLVNKLQVEVKSVKVDLTAKAKDLSELKKRYNELVEQHQEKTRQHQKLQIMYDTLRRRSINPAVLEEAPVKNNNTNNTTIAANSHFQMPFNGANVMLGSARNIQSLLRQENQQQITKLQSCHSSPVRNNNNNGESSFVLKPYPTPVLQVGKDDNINNRFTMHLNTPRSR